MKNKDFLKSKAWIDIEGIFNEELDKLKKSIPYKDKDNDYIAKRYVANREAERIIKGVLGRINRMKTELKKENTSYI